LVHEVLELRLTASRELPQAMESCEEDGQLSFPFVAPFLEESNETLGPLDWRHSGELELLDVIPEEPSEEQRVEKRGLFLPPL